ncbi:MAG: hypothetical protein M1823_005560 [Watsoniomyces obsoletus]|nr:MAG: hypothetical protein M1823_005560 [Watsoniomyces obsoletus]
MVPNLLFFIVLFISLTVSTPVKRQSPVTKDPAFLAGLADGRSKCSAKPAGSLATKPRLQRRMSKSIRMPRFIKTRTEVAAFMVGLEGMRCVCIKLNMYIADPNTPPLPDDDEAKSELEATWLQECMDELQMYDGDSERQEIPADQLPKAVPREPERKKAPQSPPSDIFNDKDGNLLTMSLGKPDDWERRAWLMMSQGRSTVHQAMGNTKGFRWSSVAAALAKVKAPSMPVRGTMGFV